MWFKLAGRQPAPLMIEYEAAPLRRRFTKEEKEYRLKYK